MDNKVKLMFKDALILTIITLVSGFLLSFVFQLTKEPIELRAYQKKMDAYKKVFVKADKFIDDESTAKLLTDAKIKVSEATSKLGKVGIDELLKAEDSSGNTLGYVLTVFSDEGYGGKIKISMGYDVKEKKMTSIEILEANETAGLGENISTDDFKNQFSEKAVKEFNVVKAKAGKENDIQALSGATISSTAVTNAVNAGLLAVGGLNE